MNRKVISMFLAFLLTVCLLASCEKGTEREHEGQDTSEGESLAKYLERANSDDAETTEEALFHGVARALVISNVEPNELGVGGREFRVKRNPAGEGCFVYDPRTRFAGTERLLVWWVYDDVTAYALNGPSKMVTPKLKFPQEDLGVRYAPITDQVIDYVFGGKELTEWPETGGTTATTEGYTLQEYEIYDFVINANMAEEDAMEEMAKRFKLSVEEVKKITMKVMEILSENGWIGMSSENLRKRAVDYSGS